MHDGVETLRLLKQEERRQSTAIVAHDDARAWHAAAPSPAEARP